MKLKEIVEHACKEATLVDALNWVALVENDRAVKQALENVKTGHREADGALWETFFRLYFKAVIRRWYQLHD